MYNNQNNALAEQKTFMLPAAIPEGEFTQEELAEDMDGLQMSFPRIKIPGWYLSFLQMTRRIRTLLKRWKELSFSTTPTMLTGRRAVSMTTMPLPSALP